MVVAQEAAVASVETLEVGLGEERMGLTETGLLKVEAGLKVTRKLEFMRYHWGSHWTAATWSATSAGRE